MATVEDVLKIAKDEIGVTEYPPNSNKVKYNTEFYGAQVSGAAYPWCCVFVWWVFNKAGIKIKKTASCMELAQWFKDNGKWHASPQVGDVVFFKFNTNTRWTNHTGIVEKVVDGGIKINDVEGNTSINSDDNGGAVMLRERSKNIVGYGRPDYDVKPSVNPINNYQRGIDISEFQGDVDFQKVKASGISFVCLRSTKKSGIVDARFEKNLLGCINNRLDYSCYKYAYATTHEQARQEADSVINLLQNVRIPIWYDIEDKSLISLGKDGIEGIAMSFIGECRDAGFEVGIYCNKNWYDNYISQYLKDKFMFWIARYGRNDGKLDEQYRPSGKNVIAWQYTSKGSIPGVPGNVDLDVLL